MKCQMKLSMLTFCQIYIKFLRQKRIFRKEVQNAEKWTRLPHFAVMGWFYPQVTNKNCYSITFENWHICIFPCQLNIQVTGIQAKPE